MSRDMGEQDNSRRNFLRNLAVIGGVATVAAGAVPAAAGPVTGAAPASSPQGYRVTPHVAKYYDKARF